MKIFLVKNNRKWKEGSWLSSTKPSTWSMSINLMLVSILTMSNSKLKFLILPSTSLWRNFPKRKVSLSTVIWMLPFRTMIWLNLKNKRDQQDVLWKKGRLLGNYFRMGFTILLGRLIMTKGNILFGLFRAMPQEWET